MSGLMGRLKHSWEVFRDKEAVDPTTHSSLGYPAPTSINYRYHHRVTSTKTILGSIYNRMGIDVASIPLRHIRVDDDGNYKENVNSGLNRCLTLEANLDQDARSFIQDVAITMFEQGQVAIVPVVTNLNPRLTGGYDIQDMRVGVIEQSYTDRVTVNLYNHRTGLRESVTLPKSTVAIIENPLYMIMNEQNSNLQRANRTLHNLDVSGDAIGRGKMDIIIQMPFSVRQETKRAEADRRARDIEAQLDKNSHGVVWTDASEQIHQLNRPTENNLLKQAEYLMGLVYGELGLTEEIMRGTASEEAMVNYYNRTLEPILRTITLEITRKFISKTAYTQGQRVHFYRDPFVMLTLSTIADIADKLTRNEIFSSNDVRQILGHKPVDNQAANELRNKNMPHDEPDAYDEEIDLEELDALDDELRGLLDHADVYNDLEFLHYASPYYDPAKAREYYLRTRKLKGNKDTKTLPDSKNRVSTQPDNSGGVKTLPAKRPTSVNDNKPSERPDTSLVKIEDRVQRHVEETRRAIKDVRDRFSALTDRQKRVQRPEFEKEVQELILKNVEYRNYLLGIPNTPRGDSLPEKREEITTKPDIRKGRKD